MMTDQEIRDLVASIAETQARTALQSEKAERQGEETRRELKETGRYIRETDRQLRELKRQLGKLGDKFGSYTEGLALPSMTKILNQRFHMDVVAARANARSNGRELEVDVLAYSRAGVDEVYVVEVKSHLRHEAIVQIKKILQEFHDFFPGHRGKKLYGILAAVDAPKAVREKALREGIYLARIRDDEFELRVPEGFQPRAF